MSAIHISNNLAMTMEALEFGPPVTHTYNPLLYARRSHSEYLKRFGDGPKEAIFLGMNPGPFGMAQTGVPFGDVSMVRDWMGITGEVRKPAIEHPKRPILGFDCERSEVSGTRLWGWARERFGAPENFFDRFLVWNYCPLSFMEESGRNRTPDKLPANERERLFTMCDKALVQLVEALEPEWVIGVGKFAEDRAKAALDGQDVKIGRILHPSPASPAANKNWAGAAEASLTQLGIEF